MNFIPSNTCIMVFVMHITLFFKKTARTVAAALLLDSRAPATFGL
jgi:hypothetical protein